MDFYYPNFINDFWRVLGLVFFDRKDYFIVPGRKVFDKEKIIDFCNDRGIAVSRDTANAVIRLNDNASDKYLNVIECVDITSLLSQMPKCKAIAATGQKAAEIVAEQLGCEVPATGSNSVITCNKQQLSFWRMPSTSRAYPLPLEKKADIYRILLESVIGK